MFALVEQQYKQSLPIAAFCDQHDISYGKFNYWRRRWKDNDQSTDEIKRESTPTGFV